MSSRCSWTSSRMRKKSSARLRERRPRASARTRALRRLDGRVDLLDAWRSRPRRVCSPVAGL